MQSQAQSRYSESDFAAFFRIGSSEEEDFDGLADITAALKSCSQRERLDLGSGDHPLSKRAQNPALQPNALPPQHSRSTISLSSGSSSHSVASETEGRLHGQTAEVAATGIMGVQSKLQVSDGEESRFMKKLQDFQKGTDMLRQQISLG